MTSIFNYLQKPQLKTFDQDPLNEVDGLIFCELAYVNFGALAKRLENPQDLSLTQAAKAWIKNPQPDFLPPNYLLRNRAYRLLRLAGASRRFGPVQVKNFLEDLSPEEESQFGAVNFYYKDQPFFVAFQGTDLHALGWKEDLSLSYLPLIPAQKKALDYLEDQVKKDPRPLSLGGHSKGGNLAIFAGIFAKKSSQDQIIRIYNYDGPGFQPGVLEEPGYRRILGKIRTIIPHKSTIGLLLYRLEEPQSIYSRGGGLIQHLGYFWEVEEKAFKPYPLSQEAKDNQKRMEAFLDQVSLDQREAFTNILFRLFGDEKKDLVLERPPYNLKKIRDLMASYQGLSQESKDCLFQVLASYIKASRAY
ncbi:MAG: DUF2974 domain-containing protein [Tissierellia bacterium]|nr:DUF2974 domain-containing protein [Tissierellia bacterium]